MPVEPEYDNAYKKLIKALEDYFLPKKNTEFEIYQFRRATQYDTESIDQFVTRLRKLINNCGIEDAEAKDVEIKHQIIQGGKNKKVRRRALQDEMSLDKIITLARTLEVSEREAYGIESGNPDSVKTFSCQLRNSTTSRTTARPTRKRPQKARRYPDQVPTTQRSCYKCGHEYPHKGPCPAVGKQCNFCHKTGHFVRYCRKLEGSRKKDSNNVSTKIKHICADDCSDSDEYIFNVTNFDQYNGKLPFTT
ncbi:uncharacterized protein LOC102807880 [Saccoglossus kowalevskii]|uniref:Uncharacterized protein LOC102807880 n=1 Tax=Saccoglossus kowalevskii TaxID=10224 RepID=A0ABM0MJJ1_SACKO|nr:PREDICTED: uncharacterized protein LOC102807880 [Saccoglossus kowalevskii]